MIVLFASPIQASTHWSCLKGLKYFLVVYVVYHVLLNDMHELYIYIYIYSVAVVSKKIGCNEDTKKDEMEDKFRSGKKKVDTWLQKYSTLFIANVMTSPRISKTNRRTEYGIFKSIMERSIHWQIVANPLIMVHICYTRSLLHYLSLSRQQINWYYSKINYRHLIMFLVCLYI